jgi:hypothetical protein
VEIFVLPGFGIAGAAGIVLIFGSLFFALFPMAPPGFDFHFQRVEIPLWTMIISMLSMLPVVWFAGWLLPKTPIYGHLTLAPPARKGDPRWDPRGRNLPAGPGHRGRR